VKRPYAFHYVRHDDKLYDLRADGAEKRALAVNSMHHQGVQKHTGKGHKKYNQATSPIIPIAWSSNILEAFCSVNHNVLAVQWHPEEMNDIRLLQNIFGQREEEQEEEIEGL
jgi:gamma-glutamyl-gamma-aminobutyrate hydrolase PuuD